MTQVPSNPMFYEPPDFEECPECGTALHYAEEGGDCDDCGYTFAIGPDPDALFDELREEGRL